MFNLKHTKQNHKVGLAKWLLFLASFSISISLNYICVAQNQTPPTPQPPAQNEKLTPAPLLPTSSSKNPDVNLPNPGEISQPEPFFDKKNDVDIVEDVVIKPKERKIYTPLQNIVFNGLYGALAGGFLFSSGVIIAHAVYNNQNKYPVNGEVFFKNILIGALGGTILGVAIGSVLAIFDVRITNKTFIDDALDRFSSTTPSQNEIKDSLSHHQIRRTDKPNRQIDNLTLAFIQVKF